MSSPADQDVSIRAVDPARLIVEELGAELVVYDREASTAHLLDSRAASIFKACAKRVRLEDLLPLVSGESHEESRALVYAALGELERAGLVVLEAPGGLSRRGLLGSLSRAASLPLVISILAPTPAAAATCGGVTVPCLIPGSLCVGGPTDGFDCILLAPCSNNCALDGVSLGCCWPGNNPKTGGCPCNTDTDCCSNVCFPSGGPGVCV